MEWLESLLPLLFLLIYFLAGIRKRRNKQQQQPQPAVEGQEAKKLSPFEEILRQIKEAAEEAQSQRQTEVPEFESEPDIAELWTAPPPLLPAEKATTEFREQGGFEHDQHGFGDTNPFSEELFERQAPSPPPPEHAPGHLDYDPHSTAARQTTEISKRRELHPIVSQLQQRGGLERALILKEILDKPRSRRS